jgi:hypothetical protein
VRPPVTIGAAQVYVVPDGIISGLFAGVTVNGEPLQVAAVLAAMPGLGLMVTVTVNVPPAHEPIEGVTV